MDPQLTFVLLCILSALFVAYAAVTFAPARPLFQFAPAVVCPRCGRGWGGT